MGMVALCRSLAITNGDKPVESLGYADVHKPYYNIIFFIIFFIDSKAAKRGLAWLTF
jgi:hypothetical protein